MTLEEIRPTRRENVLDLVEEAGQSGWDRNRTNSSRWSFVEEGKPVVMTGWIEQMEDSEGSIRLEIDLQAELARHEGVKRSRAERRHEALRFAHENGVPIRMIVCEGQAPIDADHPSTVTKRRLDDEDWAVTSFDENTGVCIVERGRIPGAGNPSRHVYRIALIWTRAGNWAKVRVKVDGFQSPSWQQRNGVAGSPVFVEVEASRWAEATARVERGEGRPKQVSARQAEALASAQDALPPRPAKDKPIPDWWAAKIEELELTLPEEISEPDALPEGAVRRVATNAYERNAAARRRCIDHYGTECVVCGFDFGEAYGPVAQGHIHVHHLTPVSAIGERYKVDPIKDLRPVCANCHSVIHLHGEVRPIDEVRALIAGTT